METPRGELAAQHYADSWAPWPVYWSAVWVGVLAALATLLVIGLVGIAVGAHVLGPSQNFIVSRNEFKWGTALFSVFGAFLSFVVGGWVAGKVAGILRSEPAMLHGAIVWLTAVPLLLAFAALGVSNYYGGWYSGLAGTPAWAASVNRQLTPTTTDNDQAAAKVADERAARAARNSALGAATALLLGLMGSVIGGWMASGEPMTFTYYRTRTSQLASRPAAREAGEPTVPASVQSRF